MRERTPSVPARIASWARADPEAPAVLDGDRVLTRARLDAHAARVAELLQASGAGPETAVGTCFERGAELVVAELGALRAGARYVPLDPRFPPARTRFMLADTCASIVLLGREQAATFPALDGVTAVVVDLDSDTTDGADEPLPAPVDPEPAAAAYTVFTSGSTGRPKGVVVPHSCLSWFVDETGPVGIGPGDVVAMAASPAFDASTFECWAALGRGAAVSVVPEDALLMPGELHAELRRRGITVLYVTGALLENLAGYEPGFAAGLRVLLFGGQVTDPAAARDVAAAAAAPGCRLIQVYGPTEATIWMSHQDVRPDAPDALPLGVPTPGATLHVLTPDRRPVAPGSVGEIYLGGRAVARGYQGRPRTTAERFVPDPFGRGRLYRTGDLARVGYDGELIFAGRTDDQVKIRGHRVEPGEVAAALRAHRGVRSAVVLVDHHPRIGPRLVAYVTRSDGTVHGPRELRTHLAGMLPDHMVPASFVIVDRIPLSATGKVDQDALRALSRPAPDRHDLRETPCVP